MVSELGIVFVVLLVFVLIIMTFFVFRHFLREHCCKRQIERRIDRHSNNAQDNGIGRHQRQMTNSNANVSNRNPVSSTEDPAPPYVPCGLSQLHDTSRIQQGPESRKRTCS